MLDLGLFPKCKINWKSFGVEPLNSGTVRVHHTKTMAEPQEVINNTMIIHE